MAWLDRSAFFRLRYNEDGSEISSFVLNQDQCAKKNQNAANLLLCDMRFSLWASGSQDACGCHSLSYIEFERVICCAFDLRMQTFTISQVPQCRHLGHRRQLRLWYSYGLDSYGPRSQETTSAVVMLVVPLAPEYTVCVCVQVRRENMHLGH